MFNDGPENHGIGESAMSCHPMFAPAAIPGDTLQFLAATKIDWDGGECAEGTAGADERQNIPRVNQVSSDERDRDVGVRIDERARQA